VASRTTGRAAPEITGALSAAAERFEPEVPDLSGRVAHKLLREVDDLGGEPELAAELRAAVQASVLGWLQVIKHDDPGQHVAPPDALALARTYALRGAPAEVLLRLYRLGHGAVFREWLRALRAEEPAPEVMDELVDRSLDLSFAFVDSVSVQIAERYASERARLVRSADAARAEAVRAILSDDLVDVDQASRTLGYELRRWHVGMVLWASPEDEGENPLSRMERLAVALADALRSSKPLLIPAGGRLLWAWCGIAQPPSRETLDGLTRLPSGREGLHAGLGDPGEGISGFATTHAEALEARRVATLGRASARVTLYPDVDLISLLASDVGRARRFIEAELGPLAADDDATLRLRATLRAYLDEGSSFVATARRLGIHENTVKYRVRRCEEALGRPAGERPLKLGAALLLAEALGTDG
jgi:DNA-binding PucR family transcriptional regulator